MQFEISDRRQSGGPEAAASGPIASAVGGVGLGWPSPDWNTGGPWGRYLSQSAIISIQFIGIIVSQNARRFTSDPL